MAQVINIQGTTPVDDPEYRYKMPAIQGKVEGRGNGIKTAIPNMTQVALSLHREPGEVTKFFGCELGAQTTWSPDTERSIVNGAHTTADLQTNLFKYIEKFVLCPKCHLPETDYKVKSGAIYQKCNACGEKDIIDMSHKLCTYILAQDKKNKKEKKDKEKKDPKEKDKKDKKKKDKKKDDDDEKESKKKDKKDKKKKDKKKDKVDEEDNAPEEEEEEEEQDSPKSGSPATSPQAAEDNSEDDDAEDDDEDEELGSDLRALTPKQEALKAMQEFMEDSPNAKPDEVVSKVRELQTNSNIALKECAFIMVSILFDANIVKDGQVKKHAAILKALAETDSNTFMARHIIGALELFFGQTYEELDKAFPLVLQQLYNEDVLEEDVILAWADAGVTYDFSPQELTGERIRELRSIADVCVNWLREDDESDDDE